MYFLVLLLLALGTLSLLERRRRDKPRLRHFEEVGAVVDDLVESDVNAEDSLVQPRNLYVHIEEHES